MKAKRGVDALLNMVYIYLYDTSKGFGDQIFYPEVTKRGLTAEIVNFFQT